MKIALLGAVFLVFLTLKLCGVLTWSWLWVTAPLWFPFALLLTVLVLIGVVAVLVAVIQGMIR